jgi:hypothetical protein
LQLVSDGFVRGLTIVRAVWPGEVVKPLLFAQLGLEVDITLVAQKLIEFLLIGSVGSLHFSV